MDDTFLAGAPAHVDMFADDFHRWWQRGVSRSVCEHSGLMMIMLSRFIVVVQVNELVYSDRCYENYLTWSVM